MKNFLSGSQPFDADVEKATNHKSTTEDWALIMEICDKLSRSPQFSKNCLRSIIKRLNAQDPHIVILAITLLDACSTNCGKPFHLEIASREFEGQFIKLIQNNRNQPKIYEKLKGLLKKWAEGDFKSDPELNLIPSLYRKLKSEGHDFSIVTDMPRPSYALSKDPNVVTSTQEEEEIAKAIELSLKENSKHSTVSHNSVSTKKSPSLYPNVNSTLVSSANSEGRKVKALYDFEAVEDNELTFTAGEIINILDDSDPNWWKGSNHRGEGLFPSNFVTADLSVELEQFTKLESNNKKSVQFSEEVEVKTVKKEPEVVEIEIDEQKMDRLLHLLHEADPQSDSSDPQEMVDLEEHVTAMGPLIDTALEKVDKQHAKLTQLSSDLVDAMNLYHMLMREPTISSYTLPKMPPQQMVYQFPHAQAPHHQAGHPQQGHMQPGHPSTGHPQQGHMQPGHPPTGHLQQGHMQPGHPPTGHPQQGHMQSGHPPTGHPQAGHPQVGHPQIGHPQTGHPQAGNSQIGHSQATSPHIFNGLPPGPQSQAVPGSQPRFNTNVPPTGELINTQQGPTSLPTMTLPHHFHIPLGLRQHIPSEVRQESQQPNHNSIPYTPGFPVQGGAVVPVPFISQVPPEQQVNNQQPQFASPNGQRMM